jgi:tRNA pseudouridine55 synthase
MDEMIEGKSQDPHSRRHLTGLLVLNKPSGPTSRAVVDRVVRCVPGTKVGHAGTLDPLATGVLVVCIGSATRLVELVQELPKSYRTMIRLGGRSETLDAQGPITTDPSPRIPSQPEINLAISALVGEIVQTPPIYSAVKIRGRRAHELARAGRPVQPSPRLVRVDRIAVLDYVWPHLELEIDCGGGTYIRSIARDLGEALGCGAYVDTLARTRIGEFSLTDAVAPEALSTSSIEGHLQPLMAAVPHLPRVVLSAQAVDALAHGRRVLAHEFESTTLSDGDVALVDQAGSLIAIGRYVPEQGYLEPRKVLVGTPGI